MIELGFTSISKQFFPDNLKFKGNIKFLFGFKTIIFVKISLFSSPEEKFPLS